MSGAASPNGYHEQVSAQPSETASPVVLIPADPATTLPWDEWIAYVHDQPTADLPRPVADYLSEAREAGEA